MKTPPLIDFRRSLPPLVEGLHADISAALGQLAAGRDLARLAGQTVARGSEADRLAGGRFMLPRLGGDVDPSRVIVTNGTQNALVVLLKTLVGTHGLLLAEALSYGALRATARWAGVKTRGLALDEHGIVPEAFEEACRLHGPKALYCNPTVHNPTTSVMPESRRKALADIARRYEVAIIEDDALGRLHPDAPKPIAALAPDICWYVMSATKCLAQGLRVAYLVAPSAGSPERLLGPVEHLSFWHAAPLSAALVSQWIASGTADIISARIARECLARERQAREILSDFNVHSVPGSMHVWVELPSRWRAEELVSAAEARRVLLRSSALFAVDDRPTPEAVRLSLSPPADLGEVVRGLQVVRALLSEAPRP